MNNEKMDQQPYIIDFSKFFNDMEILEPVSYNNKMLVMKMDFSGDKKISHKYLPVQLNAFSFMLVMEGELNITVDYIPYYIRKNSFCGLSEKHVVQNIYMSQDFKGYHIIIDHDFLRGIVRADPPPIGSVHPRLKPVITLDEPDFKLLVLNVERLVNNINNKEHFYRDRLVENELDNFVCNIRNFMRVSEKNNFSEYKPKVHEELMAKFFGLLIKNCQKEHEVAFYANELNVTPIYLSRAVKQTIGKTAIKLISDFILVEAKILLRKPGLSVQEIAEILHFSDQASFSKFFKKHTGESPLLHRKNM